LNRNENARNESYRGMTQESAQTDEGLRSKALLFLHIHKTAGTTLHRILEQEYNPFRIYTIEGAAIERSINHLKRLPIKRRASLQVVKGHMDFGLHESLPQPSTYITFLRDPLERSISAYSYSRRNRLSPFYQRINRENINLLTFLEIAPWNSNLQCKTIAGIDRHDFRPAELVRQMTQPGARPADPGHDPWSNAATLEKAKENLTHYFAFVGLTERFTEGLVILKHLFGWGLSSYSSYRRTQNRPKAESFDPSIIALVEQRNQFDRALYEYGKKLLADMVGRLDFDLSAETAALKSSVSQGGLKSVRQTGSAALRAAASRVVSLL